MFWRWIKSRMHREWRPAWEFAWLHRTRARLGAADLMVLSPGVPADTAVALEARRRAIPVVGDLELASWFLKGEIIGITGSNGKTTTTAMTGHILSSCGIAAQVGGNIGTPPAEMVDGSRDGQWNVLELSSFQLETTDRFHARIGAVLNVTPDHLDRHGTFARYAGAKSRLLRNQSAADYAVLNADDPVVERYASDTPARTVWFSSHKPVKQGACVRGDEIVLNEQVLMKTSEVPLPGSHNIENTMAAAAIAALAGAPHAGIREAVMSFPGVEHRLEYIGEANGVRWYNDSKATNVDAALKAVAAFPGNLWIILGGTDKGSDYRPLAHALRAKARGVLLIGAAAELIESQMTGELGDVEQTQCGTLARAVTVAMERSVEGDVVLLAPACSSFDQFDNYEQRGREFKRLFARMGGGGWPN